MGDILTALNGAQGQVSPPQGKTNFSYDPQQMQQQEAGGLQAPTIDPVWYATLGGVMGPVSAAKLLGQQVVQDTALSGLGDINRLSQYIPIPKSVQDDWTKALFHSRGKLETDITSSSPDLYGNQLRDFYQMARRGNVVENFDPQYGDLLDKAVYKGTGLLSKLLQSPEAYQAEKAMGQMSPEELADLLARIPK